MKPLGGIKAPSDQIEERHNTRAGIEQFDHLIETETRVFAGDGQFPDRVDS